MATETAHSRRLGLTSVATVGGNIAPFKSGRVLPGCGGPAPRSDETSPHSSRGRVAFSTLRPPRLAFWGTGAVDEAWKTRQLVGLFECVGMRTAVVTVAIEHRLIHTRAELPPSLGSGSLREPTRTDPALDQWHGVDRVIHALSTATISSQSSRGGQRVGNPHDDPGRWLSRPPRRRPGPNIACRPNRTPTQTRVRSSHFGHSNVRWIRSRWNPTECQNAPEGRRDGTSPSPTRR